MIPILDRPDVDLAALRAYRLRRITEQMSADELDLLVLVNPVSLRYAADWREYAMFVSRIPTYYLFVYPDGQLVMHGAYAEDHPTIDEFRPANFLSVFDAGLDLAGVAEGFASEVEAAAGVGARVAVERVTAIGNLRSGGDAITVGVGPLWSGPSLELRQVR